MPSPVRTWALALVLGPLADQGSLHGKDADWGSLELLPSRLVALPVPFLLIFGDSWGLIVAANVVLGISTLVLALVLWSVKRHRDPVLTVERADPVADLVPSIAGLTHGAVIAGNVMMNMTSSTSITSISGVMLSSLMIGGWP